MCFSVFTFHIACNLSNKNITRLLLQHGSEVNGVGWRLHTPLFDPCKHSNVDVVQLLLESGADTLIVYINWYAAPGGEFEANCNTTTLLEVACNKGHLAVLQPLARHKAVKSSAPGSGHVLGRALRCGHIAVVQELL